MQRTKRPWLIAFTAACLIFAVGQFASAQQASAPQRELVVGIKDAPPFAMKDASGNWTGLTVELWQRAAATLHLPYRFIEADNVVDLLAGVSDGKFDVAVGAITVTAEREQVLEFTQPYYITGLGIAVPPTSSLSWRPIVRAMTSFGFLQAVLGLVGLAISAGVLVWLFERRQNEHFGGSVGRGITSSVWWSTQAMTQRASQSAGPQTVPGRVIGVVWMVISIIAIAIFTAGVTSVLTAKQLQGLVHGVSDLGAVRVGTVSGTAAEQDLRKLRVRARGFDSVRDGLAELRRGAIDAFVFDKAILAWVIRQEFSSSAQLLEITFSPQNYALALPDGSPLRKSISVAMLGVIQSDAWRDISFRYTGSN